MAPGVIIYLRGVGRWQPNARERLVRAGLELFLERGYDSVTVAEIAERAGLTKRTFFRHLADKREVLFLGEDVLARLMADAIADAPESATPMAAIAAALEAAATAFPSERPDIALQRQTVIASNSNLQERESLKRATLTGGHGGSPSQSPRGGAHRTLAADVRSFAFRRAFSRGPTGVQEAICRACA